MRCRPTHALIPAVAVAALLAAGCGGGSSPGVANVATSTSTSSSHSAGSGAPPSETQLQVDNRDVARFARCVRSHGVPNFPNPAVAPHAYKDAISADSPAFAAAERACGHLLPPGSTHRNQEAPQETHAHVVALLAFARCLRGHGYPGFPDPTAGGQVTREMLAKDGIDLHDTALVRAADACTRVTHGVITRSVVANFVAGH